MELELVINMFFFFFPFESKVPARCEEDEKRDHQIINVDLQAKQGSCLSMTPKTAPHLNILRETGDENNLTWKKKQYG